MEIRKMGIFGVLFLCVCFQQAGYSQELETITIDIPGLPEDATPLEMIFIPAGTFMMGAPEDELERHESDWLPHEVTISQAFYLGKYEITNAQFRAFRPEHDSEDYSGLNLNGEEQPVANVNWYDAIAFCEWLSDQTSLQFLLPTEAQWEYACRAGTTERRYWGDDLNDDQACAYANTHDLISVDTNEFDWLRDERYFECEDGYAVSAPVGQFLPNEFGLFDMQGNVWEWCSDWMVDVYNRGPQVDPEGTQPGNYRVIRGGAWDSPPRNCRSAKRGGGSPENFYFRALGFRVLMVQMSSTAADWEAY